jgi:hypothetical protein
MTNPEGDDIKDWTSAAERDLGLGGIVLTTPSTNKQYKFYDGLIAFCVEFMQLFNYKTYMPTA